MVKRRSLDDALTPEEQAFMDKGSTTPSKAKPKTRSKPAPKPKSTTTKEEPVMARPALKDDFTQKIAAPISPAPILAGFSMPGVVSLNTRIEPEISAALLTASMQRKIQRQQPFTQQDIVAVALRDWLKKHGYMA
ncbi:MAG: hypothetical protein IPK32_06060 [Verrucomicrobiaceae bacterium]|nr:hypothetical protein [Verrucomicrobiaceae bacterium]